MTKILLEKLGIAPGTGEVREVRTGKGLVLRIGSVRPDAEREKLLTMDVPRILAAQKIAVNQPERLNIPFLPVIDNETIFPDYIRQSAVVSDPSVEVFCGTVAHESTPFVAARVSEEYSGAFVRFMKNGDPGGDWKAYDGTKETMAVF